MPRLKEDILLNLEFKNETTRADYGRIGVIFLRVLGEERRERGGREEKSAGLDIFFRALPLTLVSLWPLRLKYAKNYALSAGY